MGTQLEHREKEKLKIKEPRKYKVIMHNDDFTPMEFVVDILMSIFHKGQKEAMTIMMNVPKGTMAVVGIYSYDIARTKAERAVSLARQEGYPFRVTIEPEGE